MAKIPEAEPLVGQWRSRLDPGAADGVPAHVTILYPFLDHDRLDEVVLSRLSTLIATYPAFNVRFSGCGRFPGVLYLAPSPSRPFQELTEAVAGQWPETQPYGGRFAEIIPHLTVADQQEPQLLDHVETELTTKLPLAAQIREIHLLVSDGSRWREDRAFELQRLN
ncbi:2'-5' RNA ligase family protein [Spongiactinospora sp. TRM90649]|uniref:2'-5' RNA ligase family protein n=1 Tax=Spongiactinospora sp. TRM90649 TaxID=3031114 RepID=UPI0023F8E2F9|nr:2'-5' RNA ligase family protein [Spongiactinospora sp. TRM90649]MDF5757362.1 2'-5' RNA ligase family protein [Spongiactinospora sp. TRM90649]